MLKAPLEKPLTTYYSITSKTMKDTIFMLAYDINVHDTCSVKGVEHHPGKNNFVSWERNHLCWSIKIVLYFTTQRLEANYEMGRGAICLLSSV